MICKYCDSTHVVKNGKVRGKQSYLCKNCGHRIVNPKSFPNMKTEARVISTAIDLYYEGLSVRKVANQIKKIFGVQSSQVSVWNWILKYSKFVTDFVEAFKPQLVGIYKVDETAIKCKGLDAWFWEIIDQDTKFLVASHLSKSRPIKEAIALFEKAVKIAKRKPLSIYVDGLPAYIKAYNKVFRTMRKEDRPELIRRVGLRAVNSNNSVERLHGTLKDRLKPMRGLKGMETVRTLLEGWVIHYNYVRKHQSLKGKTPAQASGIDIENSWHTLIKEATEYMTEMESKIRTQRKEEPITVMAK